MASRLCGNHKHKGFLQVTYEPGNFKLGVPKIHIIKYSILEETKSRLAETFPGRAFLIITSFSQAGWRLTYGRFSRLESLLSSFFENGTRASFGTLSLKSTIPLEMLLLQRKTLPMMQSYVLMDPMSLWSMPTSDIFTSETQTQAFISKCNGLKFLCNISTKFYTSVVNICVNINNLVLLLLYIKKSFGK